MPAIWDTTEALMVVLPRSLWRGLCCSLKISPLLEGYAHIHAQNQALLNPGDARLVAFEPSSRLAGAGFGRPIFGVPGWP
jgi:hypothetical protein